MIEMYDDMAYLKNRLPDTDILQEYFVAYDRMPEFVDRLRSVVQRNKANLLNVTIRTVHKDDVSALPYAKEDMFAFVLYFNVGFDARDNEILKKTTSDLIDTTQSLGGTYYLPYQLFYSKEQLRKSYPEIDNFFAEKRRYDQDELFSNKFYEKYGMSALRSLTFLFCQTRLSCGGAPDEKSSHGYSSACYFLFCGCRR
jgi:FAD/FMN-containing dehydrogenase